MKEVRTDKRTTIVKVPLGNNYLSHKISVFASQSGCTAQEKETCWRSLDEAKRVPSIVGITIEHDFNDHMGANRHGFAEVMESYGYGTVKWT